jgi:hypothetical protein
MHVGELLETDKQINSISGREAFYRAGAMLIEASNQIGSDSDVERAVVATGEDVDAGLLY